MDTRKLQENEEDERSFETRHDMFNHGKILFLDITVFMTQLQRCLESVGTKRKQKAIEELLNFRDWVTIHTDKEDMDHAHEIRTAKALCQKDYDVLFAP